MNKYEKFALEQWGKLDGYELGSAHYIGKGAVTCDFHKISDLGVVVTKYRTIDYPFCHELIKGLDEGKQDIYMDILCNVLGFADDPNIVGLGLRTLIAIHTASVDQILEAYYIALGGK